jgi:hypothetical protein
MHSASATTQHRTDTLKLKREVAMWMSSGAVNEAVVHPSIANGGILHYISPGALDGFAIGALLSGLILLVMVPRIMRRSQPEGLFRDYFATPADGGPFSAALSASLERAAATGLDDIGDADTDAYDAGDLDEAVQEDAVREGAVQEELAEAEDAVEARAGVEDDLSPSDSASGGHRSKHRMSARPAMSAWRLDVRRGQPRHAARPNALSEQGSGRFAPVRE